MNYQDFKKSLTDEQPNKDWPEGLKALWYDAKGNWEAAHDLVDGVNSSIAKWIHAYLHRKEGDDWNASYWYRQAGKHFPTAALEEEHEEIVTFLLNQ